MGEIGEYWRDNRQHKKRKREQRENNPRGHKKHKREHGANNPPRQRCFDWMVTSGVNYAKNRSSFKAYQHINPVTLESGTGVRVIGMGTVELKVPRSPDNQEVNTLVLDGVLHIPEAICNGFNPRVLGGSTSFGEPLQSYDENRRPTYYATQFCGLWRLVLDGNPQGESRLAEARRDGSVMLSLSLFISEEDEARLFE
ncbi:hypothetical protein MGYG_02071 [Nannizzia gypsea CBS 118893]|uniref:Retrovirus-related Pol polyprotein from transposon TNT 1-94-like beta-barrel domain-containing protein n=1 Tax=Arthroderma gypseum (strain ATCC MYA-4604 / CBS 118893) TaxID=535722 RepID=E4UPM1_ARTGP|nr:hypothetical protein MGYG_02071 [Nannizzia gypsea CBS 118893]EFQ99058.1 hypothetical protein MGYG_02071 [Nannizzia gypsea CBS 118893]